MSRKLFPVVVAAVAVIPMMGAANAGASHDRPSVRQVTVPPADRFAPFAITIRTGDVVKWVNKDEDDHTVVSDDPFTTAGHKGTDDLLPASGGTVRLRFTHPGTFLYYCRFHAHLDAWSQPVAPGPDGGIQDANGNFGTPMMGVVTVLPSAN
jgi:plastocyanin